MEIVDNLKSKDQILAEAYILYYEELRLYFLKYTKEEMKAEDMIQDLFVKLLTFSGEILPSSTKGLLFSAAKHSIQDDYRHSQFLHRSTEVYTANSPHSTEGYPDEHMTCRQVLAAENALILRMPAVRAKVYKMARFDVMTTDEISETLHISRRTVESHLYSSRKFMRPNIKKIMNA